MTPRAALPYAVPPHAGRVTPRAGEMVHSGGQMLIIDRYLLRQFLQVFAICFCSLTGLFIVIDAFANLEDFVQYAEKHGNLLATMVEYYGYRALSFFNVTSSMLTLIAAMFTVAWFQRHNELTAIMAAGISKRRIMRPVILAVLAISLLAAANREFVIPSVRDKFSRNAQDLVGEAAKDLTPRFDHKSGILMRGKKTFAARQQIQLPNFLMPDSLDDYGSQLSAANAFYQPPQDGKPGGYLLKKVSHPTELNQRPSLPAGATPILITPMDADWLESDECFVVSDVTFEQLVGGTAWRNFSSTPELIAGLRNPSLDFGADVRLTIHNRILQPLMDMTLLFLGLPLVLTRESRNMFLAIGMCMGVVVAFMLINMGFQYLGSNFVISPSVAAWGPLLVFVPIAVGISEPLLE